MGILKKPCKQFHRLAAYFYEKMIALAGSHHAALWLAIVAFAESSFFPIPPDIMLIPMILAAQQKAWRIAGIATVSSVIGGFFGYAIGLFFYDVLAQPLLEFYGYLHQFETFKDYYHKWGGWIVFGAGITPFPYKVITIASGVVHLNLSVFCIASILARGLRFYLIAWLLKKYGAPMKNFIEKNLGLLSILFLILLIGGFALLKYL